jgi:hypothetical protein
MKKLLTLLLALTTLITAGTVFAETGGTPDLYDLYNPAENGRTWIGTAIPITDGVAVTSPIGMPETMKDLEIWDGTNYRKISETLSTADGKVLVLLHETDGAKPGIPAFDFVDYGVSVPAGELLVRSGDWMRSRVNRAVYDLTPITWNNREAMVMTLSGDTAIGSPLITADGRLAGMITAEYAEGVNRYVALSISEITRSLEEAIDILAHPVEDNRLEGYTVTVQGNEVVFDWSNVKLPEAPEGERLYHIVADAESSYLTYMEVTGDVTHTTMLLTPGRTYISGFAPFAGNPDDLPDQAAVTSLPEAEPLTENGFKSLVFAIAEMPSDEDAKNGVMPVPAAEITETLLRSHKACVFSSTTYSVDAMTENHSLLIALTAPDGSNYRYESGWYYDPSIMEKDEWYTSLDDTGLLEMLDESGYPEGIYEMAMYIDGKLADSFSFTLIK